MARAFQGKPVLLSRNHGVTVAAPTVAEAVYDLYYLELACKHQYLLAASGAPMSIVSDNRAAHGQASLAEEHVESAVLHFEALKRQLERDEPDYAR